MTSDAQRKASKNYRLRLKEHDGLKRILLEFYPPEHELFDWVRQQGVPMATYIKSLIRKDMAR